MSRTLAQRVKSPAVGLILDWDGTITRKDTTRFMGQIAKNHAAKLNSSGSEETTRKWGGIIHSYADDFKAHAESYVPKSTDRTTVEEEAAWLTSLGSVEHKSIQRVEDSGIFVGVTAREVKETADQAIESGELQLRDGWSDILLHTNQTSEGSTLRILSVNWSSLFIRSCLLKASSLLPGLDSDSRNSMKTKIENLKIMANEIEGLNDAQGSSGKLNKPNRSGIRTSWDKLKVVANSRGTKTIYVGDSPTDFGSLLAADVGICIRDDPMEQGQKDLDDALKRVGMNITPIAEMVGKRELKNTIYWAKDLSDVVKNLDLA
jgi:thiamine phosphate phosphatase / amino-HMP aminohydrolase